ncbi:PAS domain S-box protein, partial [Candidatus Fermentibacteria bacterium]|nr:PAS domain S-box protein [Candidatus Fermentibacteria bacterium]
MNVGDRGMRDKAAPWGPLYLLLSANGSILSTSRSLIEICDVSSDQSWTDLFAQDGRDKLIGAMRSVGTQESAGSVPVFAELLTPDKRLPCLVRMVGMAGEESPGRILLRAQPLEEPRDSDLWDSSEAENEPRSLQGRAIVKGTPPRIVFANDAMVRILGYTPGELMAMSPEELRELVHPEDRNEFFDRYESRIKGENAETHYEIRGVTKDGQIRDMLFLANLISHEGQPAVQVVFLDVTDRKRTETALQRSERLYRTLVENAFDGIYLLNDRHFDYVNPRMAEITGYDCEEMISPDFDFGVLLSEESREQIEKRYRASSEGSPMDGPYTTEIVRKNGEKAVIEVNGVPLGDPSEMRAQGVIRDVTRRSEMEKELQESKRMLSNIMGSIPGMVYRCKCDQSWTMVFVSEGAKDLTGYSPRDLIDNAAVSYADIIHPDDRGIGLQGIAEALDEHEHFELVYRIITADGSVKWVWEKGAGMYSESGEADMLEGIVVDVTDLKITQEKLRESEGRLQSILSSMQDLVFAYDSEGRFTFTHAPDESQYYTPPETFLGEHYRKVLPDPVAGQVDKAFEKARQGSISEFEYEMEMNGKRRYYSAKNSPLLIDGEFNGMLSVCREITGRVRYEREQRRRDMELQKLQKLESLGILAGGIAHDFNNLLVGIMGNAELTLSELPKDSPYRAALEKIRKCAEQAAGLSGEMLAYSGRGSLRREALQLNDIVGEMKGLLRSTVPSYVPLDFKLTEDSPLIKGDAAQIEQVLMNLVTNAAEAIGDSHGSITVATGAGSFDSGYLSESYIDYHLSEGTYVWLEVADTGSGMDSRTSEKIFDPFYTTKFTGRGLGLAAVLGIVRAHKGTIKVDS